MVLCVSVLVVAAAIFLMGCYGSWSQAARDRDYNLEGWSKACAEQRRAQEKLDVEVQQHKATRTTAIERQRVLDRNLEHATARAQVAEAQLAAALLNSAADTGLLEREQAALRSALAEVSAQNIRTSLRHDTVGKHAEAILRLVQEPNPPPAPQTHTGEPRIYAGGETQLTLLPQTEPAGDGELRDAA